MEYKLTEKDMERVNRQVSDIAEGRESWRAFKAGTISQMYDKHKTYGERFALKEAAVLCETLCSAGIKCGDCESCEVTTSLRIALDEIKRGLRRPPARKEKIFDVRKHYVSIKKDGTIVITQVL